MIKSLKKKINILASNNYDKEIKTLKSIESNLFNTAFDLTFIVRQFKKDRKGMMDLIYSPYKEKGRYYRIHKNVIRIRNSLDQINKIINK